MSEVAQEQKDDDSIKLTLSTIENDLLRRLIIVISFPFLLLGNYISFAWTVTFFVLKSIICAPFNLVKSASKIW